MNFLLDLSICLLHIRLTLIIMKNNYFRNYHQKKRLKHLVSKDLRKLNTGERVMAK